jgi:hypothetical protein
MFDAMEIRVTMEIDDELDSDLAAFAVEKLGSTSQAAINRVLETVLTDFLEGGGDIPMSRSPVEQDWELETPTGCFHIRGGRVEPATGSVPTAAIAQILAAIYREVHRADNSRGHREEKGGETKAQ